jgi:hypothetical protein
MEQHLRKLTDLLRAEFPGCEIDMEVTVPGHKVGGYLIWDGFVGVEQIDRQDRVWSFLEKSLSTDEQRAISVLLTLSPEEAMAARHG